MYRDTETVKRLTKEFIKEGVSKKEQEMREIKQKQKEVDDAIRKILTNR